MPFDVAPLTRTGRQLVGAAKLLQEKGWCQGRGHGLDGTICLAVALIHSAEEVGTALKGITFLERHLGQRPADWNDTPGRTKEEVIEMLHEAALVAP